MVNFQNEIATQLIIVDNAGNRVITIGPGPDIVMTGTGGSMDFDATGQGTGQPTIYFYNNDKSNYAFINLGHSTSPRADLGITSGRYTGVQYPTLAEEARIFFASPGNNSLIGNARTDTQAQVGGEFSFTDGQARVALRNSTGTLLSQVLVTNTASPSSADAPAIFLQNGDGTALNGPILSLQGAAGNQTILLINSTGTRTLLQDTDGYWKILNEGWNTAVFGNSWTGNQFFYKKFPDGTVRFRGNLVPGTRTGGTVIFTLPVGYRPFTDGEFICSWTGGSFYNKLAVNANGQVLYFDISGSGSQCSANGISFATV